MRLPTTDRAFSHLHSVIDTLHIHLLFSDHACCRRCAKARRDHPVVICVLDLAPFHDHHVLKVVSPNNSCDSPRG